MHPALKLETLEKCLERVYEIPFSSSRKMMLTVTKTLKSSDLGHVAKEGVSVYVCVFARVHSR